MKIAVLGAGALGCLFGAGLSAANEVTMICHREAQRDEINRFGMTIYEPDGSCHTFRENVSACLSGQCTEQFDWLILLTKTTDTDTAMELNRNIITKQLRILTLQNGGGNAERLERFCPKENIFVGTTKHNCVNLGNGTVRHSGSGITYIGANAEGESAAEIVELFNRAGFEASESENIMHLVWEKLFLNLSVNSFTAIARAPVGACYNSENAWYFIEKLICEAVDVARADGQYFSYLEILNMVRSTCEKVATGFSSMSQDVMNCRKTEIDYINGYVVNQAKRYNIKTPYNELVRNLVHAIENTYQYQEMPTRHIPAKEIILKEEQNNSSLYKIIKGKVELYMHYGEADEYLLGILGEGQCFGEIGALIGKKEVVTAVAFSDSVVMEIPKESLRQFIALNPENAVDIMKKMANNLELYRVNTRLMFDENQSAHSK